MPAEVDKTPRPVVMRQVVDGSTVTTGPRVILVAVDGGEVAGALHGVTQIG